MPEQITFLRRVIDFLIPRKCPACGRRLPISDKVICSECYFNLPRTNFHIFPEDSFIVRKYSKTIPVVGVASFFYYTTKSESSKIILQMKYFGKWSFAEYISRLYTYEIKDSGFFEGIDVIVPVPLTKKREKERGYNQSYHIAMGISEATGIPIITDAVRRVVFTESQTRKTRRNDKLTLPMPSALSLLPASRANTYCWLTMSSLPVPPFSHAPANFSKVE